MSPVVFAILPPLMLPPPDTPPLRYYARCFFALLFRHSIIDTLILRRHYFRFAATDYAIDCFSRYYFSRSSYRFRFR